MANTPSTSRPPIKLKLSLSSAALQSNSKDPSTPASTKTKGKAKHIGAETPTPAPASAVVLKVSTSNGSGNAKGGSGSSSTPVIKLKQSAKSSLSTNGHNHLPVAGPSSSRDIDLAENGPADLPTTNGVGKSSSNHSSLVSTPKQSPSASASAVSTPTSTGKSVGRPKGSKTKPKPKRNAKLTPKSKPLARPTAIPPRLLSSAPSTPKPMAPPALPLDTPSSSHAEESSVKEEPFDDGQPDPISLPISPSAMEISTPTPKAEDTEMSENQTADGGKGKTGNKWMRIKRPIKELLNKVMIELRRKDDYAFFDQPVDLEVYPDYLDVVGGEEKMMDLGTMQQKVDANEYRSMDDFENDLRLLVTAAQTFNGSGTTPYNSANRILNHGLKHIERSRLLVRTPSPSPGPTGSESGTPWRGQSTFSGGREGTYPLVSATPLEELLPQQLIPEAMLEYPPNSLVARAIGWNITGGRKIYSRRQIRARERFVGKWRHWALDGSRDLTELTDPEESFAAHRSQEEVGMSRHITDWKGLRKDDAWWEFEVGGPTGQPPIPFAPYPRPTPLRQRELGSFEWGVFPEIEAESAVLASRTGQSDLEALAEHLRPLRPRLKPTPMLPANFVNIYDGHLDFRPKEVLGEMLYGGPIGEAYEKSIERFVKGAMDGVKQRWQEAGMDKQKEEDVKEEADHNHVGLDEYVTENWHNGILQSTPVKIVRNTLEDISSLRKNLNSTDSTDALLRVARTQYARSALRQLTSHENPLNIAPLLVEQGDFLWAGVGGKSGVKEGLSWVGKEIVRLAEEARAKADSQREHGVNGAVVNGKRKRVDGEVEGEGGDGKKVKTEVRDSSNIDSAASSPLTQPPDSPVPSEQTKPLLETNTASTSKDNAIATAMVENGENGENGEKGESGIDRPMALRRLRLELVALSKFYPLAALRKMERAEAERLLPPNVRSLMSKR